MVDETVDDDSDDDDDAVVTDDTGKINFEVDQTFGCEVAIHGGGALGVDNEAVSDTQA